MHDKALSYLTAQKIEQLREEYKQFPERRAAIELAAKILQLGQRKYGEKPQKENV